MTTELHAVRASIEAAGAVEFVEGVGVDGVAIAQGGLRGVGVADLAQGRSRRIQIGLPEMTTRRMRAAAPRNPFRRLAWGALRWTVERAGAPMELVDDGERLLARTQRDWSWEDMTRAVYGDGPRRRVHNDPLWRTDVLAADPGAVVEISVEQSAATRVVRATLDVARLGTSVPADVEARELELRIEHPVAATFPLRIGCWYPLGPPAPRLWEVTEFSGPAPRPEPDLWLRWRELAEMGSPGA